MWELEREHVPPTTLAIVGPGRAGRALARAARAAGIETTLAGRSDALAACERAEAALLCVPDSAIAEAAAGIAAAVPPLRFVGHVSGATTLSALDAPRRAGAEGFSMHPLQTIPDGDASVSGAPAAVAGSSPAALGTAAALARALGMQPFPVPEESRAAYHAAAAVASNLLVALEESATELLEKAGVPDGRTLLAPLVLRTAESWAERGRDALTGPIARGDEATVERHLEAIRERAPELEDMYKELAARARELATGPGVPA